MTDVGKRREKNEDSFLVNEELGLFLVADGMGGHLGGDFASRIAVQTIGEMIELLEEDPETTLQEGNHIKPGDFSGYFRYAVRLASKRIHDTAQDDPSLRGMGTTAVGMLIRDGKAYVANVGDSRVYRVRGGEIAQITRDHSLVGEQIRAGLLTEEDARTHRLKNIITRSVGFQEDVEADIEIRALGVDDQFLLCSDGLSNMITDAEMRDVILVNEPEAACRRLIDLANERGGDDNITVVLIRIDAIAEGEVTDDADLPGGDDTTMEL